MLAWVTPNLQEFEEPDDEKFIPMASLRSPLARVASP